MMISKDPSCLKVLFRVSPDTDKPQWERMGHWESSIITAHYLTCLIIRVTPDQEINDLLRIAREELQKEPWQPQYWLTSPDVKGSAGKGWNVRFLLNLWPTNIYVYVLEHVILSLWWASVNSDFQDNKDPPCLPPKVGELIRGAKTEKSILYIVNFMSSKETT